MLGEGPKARIDAIDALPDAGVAQGGKIPDAGDVPDAVDERRGGFRAARRQRLNRTEQFDWQSLPAGVRPAMTVKSPNLRRGVLSADSARTFSAT